MMTHTERQIVANVLDRLRNDPSLAPDSRQALTKLQPWLDAYVITPLAIVAEPGDDRHERKMRLESARSLSKP